MSKTISTTKRAALERWIRRLVEETHNDHLPAMQADAVAHGVYDEYRLLELVEIIQGKQTIRRKVVNRLADSQSGARGDGEGAAKR